MSHTCRQRQASSLVGAANAEHHWPGQLILQAVLMGPDREGGYCFGFEVLRDDLTDSGVNGVADELSPEYGEPWSDFSCRHHILHNGLAYVTFGVWGRRCFELWTEIGRVLGQRRELYCEPLSVAMSFPGLRQKFIYI